MAAEQVNDNTWLVDLLVQLLNSPTWKDSINQFVLENCVKFDNFQEENSHAFFEIHKDFQNLVDSLVTAQLTEFDIEIEDFERQVEESGLMQDPRFQSELSKMTAAEDFTQFKDMMIAKHQELQMTAEQTIMDASLAEEHARKQAEEMEMQEAARIAAHHDALDAEHAAAAQAAAQAHGETAPQAAAAAAPGAPVAPIAPTAAQERGFTAAGGTYGRAAMPSGGKKVAQNDKAAAIRKAIAANTRPK